MTTPLFSALNFAALNAPDHFALRLGPVSSADITLVSGVEGGAIFADVTSSYDGGLPFAKKDLGLPKYEAFTVPIGLSISSELFDWVARSWGAQPSAKDGAILTLDANFNLKSEAEFFRALLVATEVPVLDAARNEVGHFKLRLQPSFTRVNPAQGKLSLQFSPKQKLWRTSNFRLQIDGLDCTHVSKIDAFTITRRVTTTTSASGEITLIPDRIEFPNLLVTLSQASAQSWFDWHDSFVVQRKNSDADERTGAISLLAVDAKTELSRITLHHLGIIRIDPVAPTVPDAIQRVAAELYCEEMQLEPGENG